ncbi:hypothetical protein [Fulvivirga lutea]|uniref:Uncharacterized protein n=1 Tax=Fulvivirga lutea TaxID=2810512 RepID=A0A974WIM6_9BACT|nr:hypothetical protein [Fulvivirga lutea]QSE98865.1 hypothetical protein JR347_07230 [Fulvivirga lutea]
MIKLFKNFLLASAPILIILFSIRNNGTTSSEYWSHFEEIEGKLIGPYTLIQKKPRYLINDTLQYYQLTLYDYLKDSITKYNLKEDITELLQQQNIFELMIKPGLIIDSTKYVDSVQWIKLNNKIQPPILLMDTALQSESYNFPFQLSQDSILILQHYFMIEGYPQRFALSTFDRSGKVTDLMEMLSIYRSRTRLSQTFYEWDEYQLYYNYLDRLFENDSELTITKYKGDCANCRVYMIEDSWGYDIFYDEEAFEVLRYKEKRFGFDITKPDLRFILWYDNSFVYILLIIELIILLIFVRAFFKN